MKKNLLFASLFLVAAPICAQEGPERTSQDAKVIFEQNFEEDWDAWQAKEIDRITSVEYYKAAGSDGLSSVKIWSDTTRDWSIYGQRDTLMILKNGVVVADDPVDIKAFGNDSYSIVYDGESPERQEQFELFGIDGGKRYFRYSTGDTVSTPATNAWSSGISANYRRNLFVRGINVEEESSYRLTLYVKAKKQGTKTPTFYADVMRGYFASEKPFSMGLEDDANNYKYKNTFEYKKENFKDDEWEKVTFMTYYLNDSIADRFVFISGYWWANTWKWGNPEGDTLCYIKQPDKFFVRLSFASDSTTFSVDNISLTKSWIGGVEYFKDMLRVDFGYETNLNDLADAAYESTNIAAVELPGEYFQVWGHDSELKEWFEVEIASAEYHGDGYMYMWTKDVYDEESEEYLPNEFEGYDTVLVTFINPVDNKNLCLKYTGSTFPKALDTEWIKAGKMVPNFYNEIGSMNPNISKGVYSMKNLPPVVQSGITAEYGSFQLDGSIREFTFQISRLVEYDNKAEASELALMHVIQAGNTEVWTVKEATDSTVTFERPSKYTANLAGDYEFKLMQLKGKATDYGQVVSINYSFGETAIPQGMATLIDFSAQGAITSASKTINIEGFSLDKSAILIPSFKGLYSKALVFGPLGAGTGADSGPEKCPKLYYDFAFAKDGNYDIEIGSSGYGNGAHNQACKIVFSLLDENGDTLNSVARDGSAYKPAPDSKITAIDVDRFTVKGVTAGAYKLAITLPNEGSYGTWSNVGRAIYYIKIVDEGFDFSLGYPTMSAFVKAQQTLNERLEFAATDKNNYTGDKYQAGLVAAADYKDFNKSQIETAPSVWKAATSALATATGDLNARITVVDNMWAAYNKSVATAASYDSLAVADSADYTNFAAYKTLVANCEKFENLVCNDKTDDSIKAVQAIFEADVKALDTQKASYDSYVKAFNAAKSALEAENAQKGTDEYASLQNVYDQYKTWDATSSTNDELVAATAAISTASANYSVVINNIAANQTYYNSLATLATELNIDLGENAAALSEQLKDATDDDAIAKVYRLAIKSAIYDKLAEAETKALAFDSLPLSIMIQNNELYATVKVVDRTDLNLPNNNAELSVRDKDGANIVKTMHYWNKVPVWVMLLENDYTDLLKGWTVRSYNTGNRMVTVSTGGKYAEFEDKTFWNGEVGMDWNSKATLEQTIEDLPVGYYSIGANFLANTGTGTKIEVATNDSTTFSADIAEKTTGNNGVDSVLVENETAKLKLTLTSGKDWSRVDDFYLVFRGKKEGFSYTQAAVAAKQEIQQQISFVPAVSEAASERYYDLNGVEMLAPKAGQIIIRKTMLPNGKSVTDKVLVK